MTHSSNATHITSPHPQELQDQLNDRAEAFSKNFADVSKIRQPSQGLTPD